jgi:hypothetical protein
MKYIFEPALNLFDLIAIIILGNLMSSYSFWLVLLFLPIVSISTYLQRKYGGE